MKRLQLCGIVFAMVLCACSQELPAPKPSTVSPSNNSAPEPPIQTYGYFFIDTTIDITTHILLNGKEVAVVFRPDSDSLALNSLRALTWNVLYKNANGKDMFVTGQYYPESKFTASAPNKAPSQEYHDFKLLDWYIITPFIETREKNEKPLNGYVERKRTNLNKGDFEGFEGKQAIDLNRFQRRRQ
jgi:hypothetical protein